MEWRNYYMDVIFVPFRLGIILAYHVWLWHKSQTQPFTTTFGRDSDGRRLWVPAMMEDIEKNIIAIQSLRNLIMGSTLMATTSMLICTGLGAVISSTYSVKSAINNTILGAHGEFVLGLKYAILLAIFFFSFLFHTFSIGFLNQVNILICTPHQDVKSLVTSEYITQLLDKAIFLNTLGNRLFYSALPLLLWIFGPVLTFFSSMAMVLTLYNLDFLPGNSSSTVEDFLPEIKV